MRLPAKGTCWISLLIDGALQPTLMIWSTWITLKCQMHTVWNPDSTEKVVLHLPWSQLYHQSLKKFSLPNLYRSHDQKVRSMFQTPKEWNLNPRRHLQLKSKVSQKGHFRTFKMNESLWLSAFNKLSLTIDVIINLPSAVIGRMIHLSPNPHKQSLRLIRSRLWIHKNRLRTYIR